MIKVENVTKRFESTTALSSLSMEIPDSCIYGMVGSNGAGKSTLLRLISGVYKPEEGTVTIDGIPVWDNPEAKGCVYYVSDEIYFPSGATMNSLAKMHSGLFPKFNYEKFRKLAGILKLDPNKSLNGFSKGMRRQAITILGLSTEPKYIYFDETFDGLDPVMRNFIKKLIIEEMAERGSCALITSHSLRELEDTCDQLALLHKGGIVLESDVSDLKTSRFKVQIAFDTDFSEESISGAPGLENISIASFRKSGSVANLIVSGEREETIAALKSLDPVILDVLPLSLEEVFTYEMRSLGYEFDPEVLGAGEDTDSSENDAGGGENTSEKGGDK